MFFLVLFCIELDDVVEDVGGDGALSFVLPSNFVFDGEEASMFS